MSTTTGRNRLSSSVPAPSGSSSTTAPQQMDYDEVDLKPNGSVNLDGIESRIPQLGDVISCLKAEQQKSQGQIPPLHQSSKLVPNVTVESLAQSLISTKSTPTSNGTESKDSTNTSTSRLLKELAPYEHEYSVAGTKRRVSPTASECGSIRSTVDDGQLTLGLRPQPYNFPDKMDFPVTLLGVDDRYYFYVHINGTKAEMDRESVANLKLVMDMKHDYKRNGHRRIVPFELLEENTFVIARMGAKAKGFTEKFFRGQVIEKKEEEKIVTVFDVDEPFQVQNHVPKDQIYYPKPYTVKLPVQAIKCEVEGLQIFSDMDLVQLAMKRLKLTTGAELKAILLWKEPYPKLRLLTQRNENLTTLIRQEMKLICQVEVPVCGMECDMAVKVTNVSEDGYIWYQVEDNELMEKILYFADGFNVKDLVDMNPEFKDVRGFLQDPEVVFAAPFEGSYYRAKILKMLDDDKVLVTYMDFGNTGDVAVTDLLMIELIDMSFRYIPPQARKVKLHMINEVDVDVVWSLLASTDGGSDTLIVIKAEEDGEDPEVDILYKEPGNNEEEPKSLRNTLLEMEKAKKIAAAMERKRLELEEEQRRKKIEEEANRKRLEEQKLRKQREDEEAAHREQEKRVALRQAKELAHRQAIAEEMRLLKEKEHALLLAKEEKAARQRFEIEEVARRNKEAERRRFDEEESARLQEQRLGAIAITKMVELKPKPKVVNSRDETDRQVSNNLVAGCDNLSINGKSAAVVFPQSAFFIRLLGFDESSNAFIQLLTTDTWDEFSDHIKALKEFYSITSGLAIPLHNLHVDMHVIAKLQATNEFIRAKVNFINRKEMVVTCVDLDSYGIVVVAVGDLYLMVPEACSIPYRTIVCGIEGLDIFDGTEYVQQAFGMFDQSFFDPIFKAELVKVDCRPVFRLTSATGENFADRIEKHIPMVCNVPIPPIDVPTAVTISYVDEYGNIWYQTENNVLLNRILSIDSSLNNEIIVRRVSSHQLSMHELRQSISGEEILFAARDSENVLYRAKVLDTYEVNKVHVEFVDFGNKETVNLESMILLDCVDPGMKFIPPQARMVKLFKDSVRHAGFISQFVDRCERSSIRIANSDEFGLTADFDMVIDGREESLVALILQEYEKLENAQ